MNKKLLQSIFTFTILVVISNVLAIGVVNGAIDYDEFHYGYKEPGTFTWEGAGEEGMVYTTLDGFDHLIFTFFTTSLSASSDIQVVKLGYQLDELWNTSWIQADDAYPVGVVVDNSNYIYVAGTINTTLSGPKYVSNVFVLKFRPNGTLLWDTIHETTDLEEEATALAVKGSTIYVAGQTNSTEGPVFVQKYSLDGTYDDTYYYGNASSEVIDVNSITVSGDNLYLAGSTNNSVTGNYQDLVLAKLNATSGDAYWNTTFGGTDTTDEGTDVLVSNNVVYLTGHYTKDVSPQEHDAVIIQLNKTNGAIIWDTSLNFDDDYVSGITINRFDNLIITGYTDVHNPSSYDIFTAEFNQTGHLIWNTTYITEGEAIAFDVTINAALNFGDCLYITGTNYDTEGSAVNEAFVLKYLDDSKVDYPEPGMFGVIFGYIIGILASILAILFIVGLLITYWKK